jgi:hypothetical protein
MEVSATGVAGVAAGGSVAASNALAASSISPTRILLGYQESSRRPSRW